MPARLLKRLARDDRGAFAVIFGVLAIVLVAMGGAAVDYVTVDQVRNKAQIALDAAALALQPEIYSQDEDSLKAAAQALLEERIDDDSVGVTVDAAKKNTDDGTLFLHAQLQVPMAFVALVGIDEMDFPIASQVTRKLLNVEVAFVLDNSGSMGGTKIANLKTATICAVNILFYGSCTPATGAVKNDKVRVGIVPFTYFVNVGSDYADAPWVDRTGAAKITNDNFDDDDDESVHTLTTIDRIDLLESMSGQSWKGCFESRMYPYSVDDTEPNSLNPDTLFTPEFAPDEHGAAGSPASGFYNSYIDDSPSNCDEVVGICTCSSTPYSYWGRCGWHGFWGWCTGTTTTCSYVAGDGSSHSCSCSGGLTSCDVIDSPTGLTNRELQERICKYENASVSFNYWHENYAQGPNAACPDADILPLTTDPSGIETKINNMVADGGTNIHEGTAWGFRVLSPTEPFTEGLDYDEANSKVMIIMTDGDNTYRSVSNMNETSYYVPYGYLYNNEEAEDEGMSRIGTYGYPVYNASTMKTDMDDMTLETCTNAKDAGITIYTIGLGTTNTDTKAMLTSCASSSSKAYFPTYPSELNTVFSSIAEQLSQLRIER